MRILHALESYNLKTKSNGDNIIFEENNDTNSLSEHLK